MKMYSHSDECMSHHRASQLSILQMTGLIGYYKLNEGLNHVATDQALLPTLQSFLDSTFRALAAEFLFVSILYV